MIIGKHQSAHREVETRFITENCIPVIRRISGGGTVFHDNGNLNFTFICRSEEGKQIDFQKYTRPVIEFLNSTGIPARFEGRNDIKVGGLKISGNAEHVHRNRVLHHGTLLFSASIGMLEHSIRKDKSCYITRAVDSNPSAVTNIGHLPGMAVSINEFGNRLRDYLILHTAGIEITEMTDYDWEEAFGLAQSKYRSWEWNFAYGPDYSFANSFQYLGMPYTCRIEVSKGKVTQCELHGSPVLEALPQKLKGCRHMVSDFLDIFTAEKLAGTPDLVYNFF